MVLAASDMQVTELPINDLHNDEDFNCRGKIAPIDVVDLVKSIESMGLQNPITVQPYSLEMQAKTGKKYRIVSGYRRHMAYVVMQKKTMPCIIRDHLSDVDARILNLGENLSRKDLNILQEAKALSKLKTAGLPQEAVADQLNMSRGWVQVRFMLLDLPEPIQLEAAAGLLNQQQIRDVYSLPTSQLQFEAVKQIKDAKGRGEKSPKVKKTPKLSIHLRQQRDRNAIFEMMEHIQEYIGNNFGTRCLAWAAGEITTADLMINIREKAEEQGISYTIRDHWQEG